MISAHALAFAFPDGPPLLRDVSFHLDPGDVCCLAGVNGSGKSTLLAVLAGLFPPTGGRLQIGPGDPRRQFRAVRLVLQEAELQCLGGSIDEDMRLGQDADDPAFLAMMDALLARFRLEDCRHAPIQTLSHGQKRKAAMAAALLARPAVLLLDEPMSGLDHAAILELRDIILENKKAGMVQCIASHDLEPLLDISTRLLVLEAGRVRCFDRPEACLDLVADAGLRPPCFWRTARRIEPYA